MPVMQSDPGTLPLVGGRAQGLLQAALADQTIPLWASTSLGLLLPHHRVYRAQQVH